MINRYKPAADLRDSAKGFLNGKYGATIGASLLIVGLTYVLNVIIRISNNILLRIFASMGGTTANAFLIKELAMQTIAYLVGILLVSVFSVTSIGLAMYYLKIGCGSRPIVSDVLSGYREFSKSYKVALCVTAPGLLSLLPYAISSVFYERNKSLSMLLLTLGIGLAGLALYIFFWLTFQMAYFIMADFPEYSEEEVISITLKKIRGHRGRLFRLELSFIPYILLTLASLGIGAIWLYPLMQESLAQFYLDLMNPKKVSGEWERTV